MNCSFLCEIYFKQFIKQVILQNLRICDAIPGAKSNIFKHIIHCHFMINISILTFQFIVILTRQGVGREANVFLIRSSKPSWFSSSLTLRDPNDLARTGCNCRAAAQIHVPG